MNIREEIQAICRRLHDSGLERTPFDVEIAILDNVDVDKPLMEEVERVILEMRRWNYFESYMLWRGTDIPKLCDKYVNDLYKRFKLEEEL